MDHHDIHHDIHASYEHSHHDHHHHHVITATERLEMLKKPFTGHIKPYNPFKDCMKGAAAGARGGWVGIGEGCAYGVVKGATENLFHSVQDGRSFDDPSDLDDSEFNGDDPVDLDMNYDNLDYNYDNLGNNHSELYEPPRIVEDHSQPDIGAGMSVSHSDSGWSWMLTLFRWIF